MPYPSSSNDDESRNTTLSSCKPRAQPATCFSDADSPSAAVMTPGSTECPNTATDHSKIQTGISNGMPLPPEDLANIYTPAPALASSRYNRQMLIPSVSVVGQHNISASRILIIGLGGLGSPAALYLAAAGVGKLGLLDNDDVDTSNLHRQIVHRESSVAQGMSKVQSALRGCRELNSEGCLVPHQMRLDVSSRENAEAVLGIFEDYDIVLDCTDNPATRYLISDLCVLTRRVLVSGAAQRLEGQMTVLNYVLPDGAGRGPCYRCVFPTPPSPEMVKGCGEIGILGPVVGTIGTLMASEALRLAVRGIDEVRKPTMLMYNAWAADPRGLFRSFGLRGRREDCVSCGDEDVLKEKGVKKLTRDDILTGKMDYITFCGVVEDIKLLSDRQRITAPELLEILSTSNNAKSVDNGKLKQRWTRPILVDTRERHEVEMGPNINCGINIPISKILRQNGTTAEMSALIDSGQHDAVIFICQRGNDSQVAAKKLLDTEHAESEQTVPHANGHTTESKQTSSKVFIGDVIGGYAALDRYLAKR